MFVENKPHGNHCLVCVQTLSSLQRAVDRSVYTFLLHDASTQLRIHKWACQCLRIFVSIIGIHAQEHTRAPMHARPCTHAHSLTFIYVHMLEASAHFCGEVQEKSQLCVNACMSTCSCICVCRRAYVCVYVEREEGDWEWV